MQGIREKIYCVRGKWDDKLLFEKPVRYLDLQQSCAEPYGSKYINRRVAVIQIFEKNLPHRYKE